MISQIPAPIAGVDYPKTWSQFLDWFHSEDACRLYLEALKWPSGFQCPKCRMTDNTIQRGSRFRWTCRTCRHQSTVIAGTIFEKTRTELRVWFAAIWYITNQKHGVSALGLQRVLGLGSYETAWTMLHRLRRAMVRPGRELLTGVVEVDESYVSLRDRKVPVFPGNLKSQTPKLLVAIAVEMHEPKGFGKIRIRRIETADKERLIPFIKESISPGSCIHSDGSSAYLQLEHAGYEHRRFVHLGSATPAHESMPGVHRVASLLQRWLLGIHHGAIQPKQLDFYLDEFVFRFNRRTSRSRGLLFYRLLQQAVVTNPVTYSDVVGAGQKA